MVQENKSKVMFGTPNEKTSSDLYSEEKYPTCVQECMDALKAGKLPPKVLSNMARAIEMWESDEDSDD